jgi:hypothetical protein
VLPSNAPSRIARVATFRCATGSPFRALQTCTEPSRAKVRTSDPSALSDPPVTLATCVIEACDGFCPAKMQLRRAASVPSGDEEARAVRRVLEAARGEDDRVGGASVRP